MTEAMNNSTRMELIEGLMQNPVTLLNALSAYCHVQAEQHSDEAHLAEGRAWPNHWAETAELIDLALAFWRDDDPIDVRRCILTTRLESIKERVESYLRP
jgi:hypothetical protein